MRFHEVSAPPPLAEGLGLVADVRRQLVGMLSDAGMSPNAVAPVIGVTRQRVSQIRAALPQGASDLHPEPERINPTTGEVVPAPTVGIC